MAASSSHCAASCCTVAKRIISAKGLKKCKALKLTIEAHAAACRLILPHGRVSPLDLGACAAEALLRLNPAAAEALWRLKP